MTERAWMSRVIAPYEKAASAPTEAAPELVPEAGIEPARLSARDFLTTSTFAAALLNAGRSWSGARLHHSLAAVGARRLLSTPSQAVAWAWLGVGSDAEASRAFADFDGLHFGRFPPKAQIVQVPCVYRFHHSGVVRNAQEHLLPSTGA